MTRFKKRLWLALSLWPLVYMLVFFSVIVGVLVLGGGLSVLHHASGAKGPPGWLFLPILLLFPLHFLTIMLGLGLMIYNVVWVLKQAWPSDQKILWVVILFLGHSLAAPLFWYFHIRPLPESDEPAP